MKIRIHYSYYEPPYLYKASATVGWWPLGSYFVALSDNSFEDAKRDLLSKVQARLGARAGEVPRDETVAICHIEKHK